MQESSDYLVQPSIDYSPINNNYTNDAQETFVTFKSNVLKTLDDLYDEMKGFRFYPGFDGDTYVMVASPAYDQINDMKDVVFFKDCSCSF